MHPTLLAAISICLSVAAQFALKHGMKSPEGGILGALLQPMVLLGLALYGLSAVVWLSVLQRWEVSKAYPMVGAGFALTVLIGHLAGDSVTALRWAGVLLICAGVFLVSRS